MKGFASLFLLLTIYTTFPAVSYAQQINLSFKNAPLQNVIAEINHQTRIGFIFDNENVPLKRVTIKVSKATLQKVLIIFQQQGILSVINGGTVTLSLAGDQGTAKSSRPVISGKVMNERGEPLDGVTITVKNSSEATSTDRSGEFRLKITDKNVTLLFTGVGVEPYEAEVNGRSNLLISLKTQASTMAPVIVSTGYQEVSKDKTAGSFVQIDNVLYNRKVGSNILDRIDGIAPGVLFDRRNSGNLNIQVRGLFTLTQSISQPLIVVDNFPYEGNIRNLNPNDVESVTILKDAAASSIWGARAGNGVFVINMKKARFKQPLRAFFNSNISFLKEPDLFKIPNMSPAEYVEAERTLFNAGVYDNDINDVSKPLSPVIEILLKKRNGLLNDAQVEAQLNLLKQQDIRNDFRKYLYRTGLNQQYAINVTGGTDKTKHFFSAGYDRGLSNLAGNSSNRITLRSDNTFIPVKNLQVRAAVSYTQMTETTNSPLQYTNDPAEDNTRKVPLYSRVADDQGIPLSIMYDLREAYTDTLAGGRLLNWKYMPLQELANNNNVLRTHAITANLDLTYKLTKAFTAEVKYQYQRFVDRDRKRYNMETYYARDQVNRYTQFDGNDTTHLLPAGTMAEYNNAYMNTHAFRSQLNFEKNWELLHRLTAFGGFEIREADTHRDIFTTYPGKVNTAVDYPTIFGGTQNLVPDAYNVDKTNTRFVSLYSNASYTFNNKYLLTGSLRRDASNVFGVKTNQKWVPLWSVGAGWKISNEDFYKLSAISYLNLRATYGFSGNINNSWSALTTIIRFPSTGFNVPYNTIDNNPNPQLRWEKVRTFNMGMDFRLKDRRADGSIEYFSKKSSDVLTVQELDPTVGISSLATNSAGLTGSGLDFQINTWNIDRKDFKWRSSFIYSHIRYKVSEYSPPPKKASLINDGSDITPLKGYTPYLLVSTRWAGLDAMGNPQGILNGNISKDYTTITNLDSLPAYHVSGSALPLNFGSFLNTFYWKGFSVSANIIYKLNYFFRRPTIQYEKLVTQLIGHPDYLKRWQKAGDEYITNVPGLENKYPFTANRDRFYANSEVTVEKGDHIRLDDIRFSYDLDNIKEKWGISHIQFYLYTSNMNIIVWKANKAGIDPDFPNGVKPAFSVAAGFKVDF